MKKTLIFALMCILVTLSACSKKDSNEPEISQENAPKHQVTFRVDGMVAETQPMNAPGIRKVAPLTDDDGQQMTRLYLFDGADSIFCQENTDPEFGTITVLLTAGEHHLHFVGTRSTGLNYNDGVLSFASLRPTFGKHFNLNVTGGGDQNLNLDRITGQVVITIEDEIPVGADKLRIQMGDSYMGIDPTTFNGVRTGAFDQTTTISGKVGTSRNEYKINILTPVYGTEATTTFTLTATNTAGGIIGQATGTIPICNNTKTLLHGNLFTGTRSMVALTTAWNADEDISF